MPHKIREQVLDLTINGGLDAFRAQHLAGPFYYRQLLPAIAKIFDELSNKDEVITIDKLDIDIGVIAMQDLENTTPGSEWENILRDQIKIALQEQRMQANMQRIDLNTNIARQWLFYMEHGYLEWNSGGFDEVKMQSVLEVLATDYVLVEALRKLISKSNNAIYRIVRGHKEDILISLMEILTASSQQNLQSAIKELIILLQTLRLKTVSKNFTQTQLQQEIWIKIIQSATTNKGTSKLVEAVLQAEKIIVPIEDKELTAPLIIIQPQWKETVEKLCSYENSTSPKPETVWDTNGNELETNFHELDEDGIFVVFAGIILVHPFLTTFFKRLSLVEGGKYIDAKCVEKAVHLLYFLATGKTNPEEHELVIPKLLCELPLHYSLKEIIELTDEEKQEANELLSIAIEKWEKLGSTTIETLRETFLQRAGKLYTKNDQLRLQVEGKALDILLDYLPWTLSIVKLPWMKKLLHIEWR